MIVRFHLTMPNVGSWNGVDTGKKDNYFLFKELHRQEAEELNGKSFYYDFGDGWSANVECQIVQKPTKTAGFRGYEWMVDEILVHGRILTLNER